MITVSSIFNIFSIGTTAIVLTFFILHLIARLFNTTRPVNLHSNSLVVITGACMGIGKQMAL